jgi:hypothetical protein
MNSLNVQQTVHLLPIPFEMAEIINGYLFDTKQSVVERRRIEYIKEQNIFKIKQSWASRAMTDTDIIDDPETNEQWWITSYGIEPEFQAVNCRVCGNYKLSNTIDIDSEQFARMRCNCENL